MSRHENILITVAGSTPQILTETLYDLIIQRKTPISRIVIITTLTGQKIFDASLFDNGRGMFYRFCSDYGLKARQFAIDLQIITNRQGQKLHDIRSEEENRAAADFIMQIVRHYTNDPKVRVLASIAGGRKTMSTFMGFAMLFYARSQDKLFHVLIAPRELENNRSFFYPPADRRDLQLTVDQQTVRIPFEHISITNAEIPFIRLRDSLPFINAPEDLTYDDLVQMTQKEINSAFTPVVETDPAQCVVRVKWRNQQWNIKLKPMDFAFYVYLLQKRSVLNSKDHAHGPAIQQIYLSIRPGAEHPPLFTHNDLVDSRARINRLIKQAIPYDHIARYLVIRSQQQHRIPTYSIALPQGPA